MHNVEPILGKELPPHLLTTLRQSGDLAKQMGVVVCMVGGSVRDLLLGRPILDVDLVVEGNGIAFARTLGRQTQSPVKAHKRFGTATVTFQDTFKIDVATARTESYGSPAALPKVKPSSIDLDLARRDFTINTLAVRLNPEHFGQLIDNHGGLRDLESRTIRVLHDQSFVDDPTRVWRAIRFEQRFGFRLSQRTHKLIHGARERKIFSPLSNTRLFEEIVHTLSEKHPRKALARLAQFNVLGVIHPTLTWSPSLTALLRSIEQTLAWFKQDDAGAKPTKWVVYFMALMDALPQGAVAQTLKQFPLPAIQRKKIQACHTQSGSLLRRLASRSLHYPSSIYHLLVGLPDDTLLFLRAKSASFSAKQHISAFLRTYQHVEPSVTGDHLKALGLHPGPAYRRILDQLRDARLNGTIKTEAEEHGLARKLAKMS